MRLNCPAALIAALTIACRLPPADPLPPGTFAFGVFGDAPYRAWEMGRFHHLIDDINRTDLEWVLHVGDLFWYPCSNDSYANRLAAMNAIRHPVVYTPGDNEWTDCYENIAGGYRPLERLQRVRAVFFARPGKSLGGRGMDLASQSADSAYGEFVENVRWRRGGFVFATVHLVGSDNATQSFTSRNAADDEAVRQRTAAALAWIDQTFRIAQAEELKGVVLAWHGDLGLERRPSARPGYDGAVDHLEDLTKSFPGQVLLIHGDSHELHVDHPLRDRVSGDPIANFTRLETFGSPDVGWVRVVVDSLAGRIVGYEPRLMRWWWLW